MSNVALDEASPPDYRSVPGSVSYSRVALIVAVVVAPILQLAQSLIALRLLPPFWKFYADPPYMYLFNSLSLGTGLTPQHVDHPGTSLQWLMAGIERITFVASGLRSSLPADIAWFPEKYLSATGVVLAVIFAGSMAFLTLRITRTFGSLAGVVSAAAILGASGLTVPWLVTATPEAVVASCSLLILALLVPTMADRDRQPAVPVVLTMGLLFAVGLTAKVIMAPLVISVIVMLKWRQIIGFGLSAVAAALVILVPVFELFPRMFGWFTNLAGSSGRYGGDSPTSITSNFVTGMQTATVEYWLVWAALIVLVVMAVAYWRGARSRESLSVLIAAGGLGAGIAAVLAVSFKETTDRDFILLVGLVPTLLALGMSAWARSRVELDGRVDHGRTWVAVVVVGVLALSAIVSNVSSFRELTGISERVDEEAVILQEATPDSGTVIHSFLARNEFYPLMLGSEWAYHPYSQEILTRFPDNIFYNPFLSTLFGNSRQGNIGYLNCDDLTPLIQGDGLTFVMPGDYSAPNPEGEGRFELQDGTALIFAPGDVQLYQGPLSTITITECLSPPT